MEFCLLVTAAFGKVFMQAAQTRNIVALHYKSAFVTSWLMTAGEVLLFSAIAVRGWSVFLPIAVGSSLGVVSAMCVHKRLFNKPK